MCTAFAASLRNKLGLQDGDCVSIMLPNTPEFPLAVFGSIEAGCIVSTINHAYMAGKHKILMYNERNIYVRHFKR